MLNPKSMAAELWAGPLICPECYPLPEVEAITAMMKSWSIEKGPHTCRVGFRIC